MSIFEKAESRRYARHFVLPEFGKAGQAKLKAANVLVVGAGGLGSPVLLYLAAAGVGHIGIIDDDVVDESNLQRQVLYTTEDIGKPKVEIAKQRILALNPHIKVTTYQTRLEKENVFDILQEYEIVADGTDNFATRYLVNDACVIANKINVFASIFRFEGQVSVFNYLNEDGTRGTNYRDLFPEPPAAGSIPNCAEGGVLGVLPGIVGSMQANEVIKVITGIGKPLKGRLFLFDAANFTSNTIKIPKNPNLVIDALTDYEIACAVPQQEISAEELKKLLNQKANIQLIDVRETWEYEAENIGAKLIPLGEIAANHSKIARDKQVIIHCKSGARSAQAIELLERDFDFTNLYNLKGGIMAM